MKLEQLTESTEINPFATDNNITVIKKTTRSMTLDVNGIKVKIDKKTKSAIIKGQGRWGELAKTVRGVINVADVFDDQPFSRRSLEVKLLALAKHKNVEKALEEPEYNLDTKYGEYQPFINWG